MDKNNGIGSYKPTKFFIIAAILFVCLFPATVILTYNLVDKPGDSVIILEDKPKKEIKVEIPEEKNCVPD